MTYDICKKKCLFFRRVEDPKIRRKKHTIKSGAKKWVHDFLFKVSLTFVQTLTRSIDPGSAAVSLWLSRHLDSHGSERLWSIRESHLGVFPSDGRLLTGTAHLVSERDPVRMLTQRRPMSW